MSVRLHLVSPGHRKILELLERARQIFRNDDVNAERWVQAKLYVAGRKPTVRIGAAYDSSRALRQIPRPFISL